MGKNAMKLSWLYVLCYFVVSYAFLVSKTVAIQEMVIFSTAAVVALLCFYYLTRRVTKFGKGLARIFKRLISGNYEVGLKLNRFCKDEIETLGQLIGKFLDSLRTFDQLRVDRIALNSRGLDIIYNNAKEGIIIADMEKEIFKFNKSTQSLFLTSQETFTFESIRAQKENQAAEKLFFMATKQMKIPQEGRVVLQLPVQNSRKEVLLRVIPVKDKDEKVKLALIFVSPA